MAMTLEEINQEFYIDWYLAGRQAPQAYARQQIQPPQPALQDEVNQWIRELADDPDLEDAEDILDAAMPEFRPIQVEPPPPASEPPQEAATKASLWKSVSNILFYAALVAIVLGAVIFGGKANGSTQLFGYRYFEVLTSSMQRVIPQGSLVVTKEVPSRDIKVGDVITYLRSDEETITHEVVAVVPDFDGRGTLGFRTKGTENPEPDPDIVAAANVIGIVTAHVGSLGFALRYVADNIKYVFIAFVLIILVSIALRVLLGDRDSKGKQSGVQQSEEDCGHNFRTGRTGEQPGERNKQLCKRHNPAAAAAAA